MEEGFTMEVVTDVLEILAALLGAGLTLWGAYYLLAGLMSWRRPMDYGAHPAMTRFAVLIAARNEGMVIGPLVESLRQQQYPKELYDIWVIPNNCTDNTAQAARDAGARVLECTVPVTCKGEVLRFAYSRLCHRGYDAYCVFDADNVVHPEFLHEMKNANCSGARAAQGYRDSKNPYDSAISGCCSIYYWMMDRFYNGGKAGLGLSAMINGTGFMVADSTLKKLGGWCTGTISEDMEMTALCVLADVKVHWVPLAQTFDEQPLTLAQSNCQRRRWTSGTFQVAEGYLPRLSQRLTERPSLPVVNMGMDLVLPAYQLAMLANLVVGSLAAFLGGRTAGESAAQLLSYLGWNVGITALVATLTVFLVLTVEGKWDRRLWRAVGCYWLFLLSWLPITVVSAVKGTTRWEEIRHTRSVKAEAVLVKK